MAHFDCTRPRLSVEDVSMEYRGGGVAEVNLQVSCISLA